MPAGAKFASTSVFVSLEDVALPANAGATGAYAGTDEVPADAVTSALARATIELTDSEKASHPAASKPLIDTLVRAADSKALSKNNRVSWGSKPMDYPVINAVFAATVAYAATFPAMTSEQRQKVHAWLTPLVQAALNSRWNGGPDNKILYRETLGAFWGRLTGDAALIERATEAYKLHIQYMRPDGSFGRDASRGGSGGHYTILTTAALIFIASMDRMDGGNLYEYAVDGRDIHSAVDFLLAFADDLSLNKKYARRCEGASMGTIDDPNTYMLRLDSGHSLTAMRLYAAFNPNHPNVARWKKLLPLQSIDSAVWDGHYGGLACFLASR
jgi:hypothetical protein